MVLFCYAGCGAVDEEFCHANACSAYTEPRLELLMRNVYFPKIYRSVNKDRQLELQ